MKDYLKMVKDSRLTQNEISILLEAGYLPFTRDDLLRNCNRVEMETYNAPALSRTIAKLSDKGLLRDEMCDGKRKYYVKRKCISYGEYEKVILAIARSKIMTLNTMRASLYIILNDNKLCSVRHVARGLNLDPDYIANTVLPRMYIVGLIEVERLSLSDANLICGEDKEIIAKGECLMGFRINTDWNGKVSERWL